MQTLRSLLYVTTAIGIIAGCSKPDIEDHGITESNLNADFTVTPVAGSAHRFVIAANDSSYIMSKWDLDNGAGAVIGSHSQNIFLPDAGTYNIKHFAIGKGGVSFSANKTVNIVTSDPASGNLVQGAKFETAEDEAKWTKVTISGTSVTWTRANGKMTVAGGGNNGHAAIYQAVQVQANKDYRFGMIVSGSGATDTWFEVYFGTAVPGAGDYSSGGIQIALNTWAGCGNAVFSGNINAIGCEGALKGKEGKVRFAQSGTIYLFIKCGGANLGTTGISIDNVELRGI